MQRRTALVSLVLLAMAGLPMALGAEFTITENATDADGVRHFTINSPYQSQPTTLRILAPADAGSAEQRRLLFVLPVEAKEEHHYGDGLTEIRKLDLHNKHKLVAVAPSFAQLPWYADHPGDAGIRQESYMLKVVLPAVDQLYPARTARRLLLGFSKSGWGAFGLILRHPELFDAASAWDAPLMKAKPDQFGMGDIFGTQENFEAYQITRLLKEQSKPFQKTKRLALSGYENFRPQVQQAHALMESLGILHDYADGPLRKHMWGSGWVEESVKYLDAMAR
ncbi:MAG: hypothetical protein NTW87_26200 [Planctomycetota bacterium]|nr:hypothetical protein [Planctomycetota bacterium]